MGLTEDPTGSPQATPVEIRKIAFSLVSVPIWFYLDLQTGCVFYEVLTRVTCAHHVRKTQKPATLDL